MDVREIGAALRYAPTMEKNLELKGRAALVINECQLGVVDRAHSGFPALADQVADRGILDRIATLADAFRAHHLPVIHAPVVHRKSLADIQPNSLINALSLKSGRMTVDSPEVDFVAQLRPHADDIIIDRPAGLIAFNGTNLDATLRRMEITTVVLTGVSTNIAMPGNTMTAVDLGYYVVIPEDCIAGSDPETHRVILNEQLRLLARITTSDVLTAALR